jgi:hypothetical protein
MEKIRIIRPQDFYDNPLSVFKSLDYGEFIVLKVLLDCATAISRRQILKRIVLFYIKYCLAYVDSHKMHSDLVKIEKEVRVENNAGKVNKCLKEINKNIPTIPARKKIQASLDSLVNMHLVQKRAVVGKKAEILYYVEPAFYNAFDKKRKEVLEKRIADLTHLEAFIYQGNVEALELIT